METGFVFVGMIIALSASDWRCIGLRVKDHPILEFLFFFGVSGIAILIGSFIMGFLIHTYGTTTTTAFLANIIVSLLINFFIRKHVIFKD